MIALTKFNHVSLVFLILILTYSCARFRIQELEPQPVFAFSVTLDRKQNADQKIQLLQNGRVFHNLPAQPLLLDDQALIADPAGGFIRVYNIDEDRPHLLLGYDLPDTDPGKDIRSIKLEAGIPGQMAADPQYNRFCVQLSQMLNPAQSSKPEYPVGSPAERPTLTGSAIAYQPSLIQCLDREYNRVHLLGRGGSGDKESFRAIRRLRMHQDQLLEVLHTRSAGRNKEILVLDIYKDGQPFQQYDAETLTLPATLNSNQRLHIEIEDIQIGSDMSTVFLSVGLRKKSNYDLNQRIIYRLDGPKSTPVELFRTDDPSDHFAFPAEDGGFNLMNATEDGNSVLFKIFSPEGEYLNNQRIVFPDIRSSWRETFFLSGDRIMTSRLYRGQYELYEWK